MSGANFRYALIAHGTTPLAEYSVVSGNSRSVILKMLESLDPSKPRSYADQQGGHILSLTDADRISYDCVVDPQISQSEGYSFLEEVKLKWCQRYGNSGQSFAASSKNDEFGNGEMASIMRNYNSQTYDKINKVKQNLENAQAEMTQNLTMALARGEQLSMMEQKADDIRASAQQFQRQATNLKWQQCFNKWRWWILGVIIVLVVIFVIVMIICKPNFSKCKSSSNDAGTPTPPQAIAFRSG
jgi:vesicle-associated membrane protein 7